MPDRAFCLYAVVWSAELQQAGLTGLGLDGASPLVPVTAGKISGIVSEVPLSEFSSEALHENLQDLDWLEPKVRKFDLIIRSLAEQQTIVPVRFGTVYLSRESVHAMLQANYQRLHATLETLKGRFEMGLTFSFDKEKLAQLALENNQEIRALRQKIESCGPGAKYLLSRKLESRRTTLIDSLICDQMDRIVSALQNVCIEVRAEPSEHAQPDANVCQWKTACLVEKEEKEYARQTLLGAVKQAFDNAIGVRISGPWPPYSFSAWEADSAGQQGR